MRILKSLLPLLVLLLWSTTAKAQYNPTDPPEPGVNFTLTTRCIPAEAGYSISGGGSHAFGSNVRMSVRTTTGYRFICWEDEDGTEVSTTTDFTYVMPTKNVTLTARFEYDPTSPSEPSTPEFKDTSRINIEINPSEAGYLSSGSAGEYETGSVQRFAVRNNSYYRFVNWTLNGIEIGTSTTLDFTVPSGDQTLVANFAYDPDSPAEPSVPSIPHTLTLQTNLAGAATLSGGGNHEPGTNVSINANANTYYHFINWTDDEGTVVSEASRFTYTMPNHHVKLTANYTYDYDPTSPGEPGTPNPDNTITENMVLWPRMGMYDDTHVQILCETPGATIHYTLDGTEPNAESPVYTEPVFVASNLLVRAIAYKEGMDDSPIVNYQVTVYKAIAPVFTFENRKIVISSETPDAIIRYTLDFTNPNVDSEVFTIPFEPEENCRIKAYASKEGLTDSPISVFVFRKADYTLQAPTFSIDEDGRLVIIPAVEGGQTYYTLDGSDPTSGSALYSEPLLLEGNFKIKAFTLHPNYYDSLIGEYSMGGFQVETPTFSYADLALTMATATSQAILRYTLDGTIPSEESAQYTAPLRLTEDCKIVARGFKENYEPSDTVSYNFILADHKAAAPVMTYDPEALTVTMSCPTQDAEIRYSVDGEAPTTTTGIRYEGPVTVVGNHTYTAVAFRNDLFASDPSSVTVDDQKVPTPTASFANKLLTLSCTDADAEIHYTTDGNAPTSESALYSEPLTLREDCTVRFFAIREDFNDSEANSYVFVYADHQVATPVLNYDRENLLITISTATEGAEIRYTIDGSVPTAETGTIYTEPIAVVGNHTFTARAFLSTLFDSSAATYTVDDQTVPTPIASFADKHLTLSCSDPEARIHYTIDGSEPTPESALYSEPLALTEDCTVRFIGVRDRFNDSEPGSFAFVYADHQVATPMLEYDSEARTMTMSCATPGALIRYTNDGTEPTATTGTEYTATFEVVGNQTFKAIAVLDTLFDSEVAEKTVDDQTVPTPTASFANKHLTLTCSDPEARIYYTVDASAPTTASTPYSGPVALTEDCTVRFIGVRDRFNDSEPGSFAFVYADHQVATPMLEYDSEARSMTMSCATPGALIRYTNDGTEPTATTGTEYTATFEVVGNQTFKAIAVLDTLFDSEVAERTVDDQTVPTPTASFADKHLTLTCADPEAQILYTTERETVRAEWTPYTAPIALTQNCIVNFYATRENFNNSDTGSYQFLYTEHQVATPRFDYNRERKQITITCDTLGAEIRYTTDGSDPTSTSGTVYTGPIAVVGNHIFTARAFRSDLFDSEKESLTVDDQNTAKPYASFSDRHLTLICADSQAQIRYTTDGNAPTQTSALYERPIALTQDCVVRYTAFLDDFNPTEGDPFKFVYTEWQVATPELSYDTDGKQMTIRCTTEGAVIRYTIDAEAPTATTGIEYNGTFDVIGNHIYRARAFMNGLFDSEAATYTVTNQTVPTPVALYSGHHVALSCPDPEARILYSIETRSSVTDAAIYSSPIPVDRDCVIRFHAYREYFNDSEEDVFEFKIADYTETEPVMNFRYRDREIEITHSGNLPVAVTINGVQQTMPTPATVSVTPVMTEISAYTPAQNDDRYDSRTSSDTIVFHSEPIISFDSRKTVSLSHGEDDPYADSVTFDVRINRGETSFTSDTIEIDGFAYVTATAKSDSAFRSQPANLRIDHYNTGSEAGARNGHRLAEAFPENSDRENCNELRVTGEMNREDFLFIGSLPNLTSLDLAPDSMNDDDLNGVFAESSIKTVTSTVYPEGMLKGMPKLTTVIWNSEDKMPDGRIAEAGNPNILFWTSDRRFAPADAVNIVTATDEDTEGHAESITLQTGYPFNAYRPFRADKAEVTKTFDLPTEIGICAGWETIALPFTPDSVIHETAGCIVPYTVWDGPEDSAKPFWLYYATEEDWVEADTIVAGTPYIISMPNNEEYVNGYSLPGRVTFAGADVDFANTDSLETATRWKEGATFIGTFMPVEEQGIRSLNVNVAAGLDWLGSAFVDEDVTLPFGAYMYGSNLPSQIPVFGDWSGIITPTADTNYGIKVETPAPGMIRISSGRAATVTIVTPEGAVIRTLRLQPGESQSMEGLTRGLYIAGGKKVMVR